MIQLQENYNKILGGVESACKRAGRNPENVRIMAVTKTKGLDTVKIAYENGFRLFGENRVQEAVEKFSDFYKDAELHIIGPLQSNKVKKAVELSSCIQSVDRLKIAGLIDRYAGEYNKIMDVFIEYNTSGEDSKSGFSNEDDLFDTVESILGMENIRLKGLMTIGPLNSDTDEIRKSFRLLRNLKDSVNKNFPEADLTELSMGMSGDYEIAVEEGATLIRVGTALFGERSY